VKLIWTYSKRYKRGSKNNTLSSDYIEFLYKKSIKDAGNQFKKIIYTDEESKDIFKDFVDEVKLIEPREFVFLADLKFYVLEKEQGEFCCIDGDLFLKKNLNTNKKTGFEFEFVDFKALEYSEIFKKEGILDIIPYWEKSESSFNLGLMYFNDDKLKKDLVEEFKKVQNFYLKKIEPKYKFNAKKLQVSICGSQFFTSSFFHHKNIIPEFFGKDNDNEEKFEHIAGRKKDRYLRDFKQSLI